MRKFMGVNRNKFGLFQASKQKQVKKKNRFKIAGKDEQEILSQSPTTNNQLITNTTQNSSNQDQQPTTKTLQIYEKAKNSLKIASELRKKISHECKLRITSFKESQARKYDQNISNLSKKAIENILISQKCLNEIRKLKGTTEFQEKYYRNMEKSLAQEIRESSRQLRAQEKQHYQRIKSYERGTTNVAIELSETQKQKMKSDFEFQEPSSTGMVEQFEQHSKNSDINELVKSINKLTTIYKELNELVIDQGSIIDRIDVNIEQTLMHVEKGVEHLQSADRKASSPCAQKCMLVLFSLIMILAVILGLKYSKQ